MAEYHIKNMNETVEKGDYTSLLEGDIQNMYKPSIDLKEEVLTEDVTDEKDEVDG